MAGGDHASLIENMQPAFVSAVVNFLERPVWRRVTSAGTTDGHGEHPSTRYLRRG